MGQVLRRMPEGSENCYPHPREERLYDKFQQVSSYTLPVTGMAGSDLEYEDRTSIPSPGQGQFSDSGSLVILEIFYDDQETNREISGPSTVCGSSRSSGKSSFEISQFNLQSICQKGTSGQETVVPKLAQTRPQEVARPLDSSSRDPFQTSTSIYGDLHGCFQDRMGSPFIVRPDAEGTWSLTLRSCHINLLELATVFIALKRLNIPYGTHLRLHSDNATVVACLNKGGSSRSSPLNSWTVSILTLMSRKGLYITAFHVEGARNVLADALSRGVPISSEWSLDQSSFHLICQRVGVPEIDMFATRLNAQLPRFISPFPDPLAVAVDAFAQDWNKWNFLYLYPPVKILMRVLSSLETFKGKGVIVTPYWPTQPWFPHFQSRMEDFFVIPNPVLSQTVKEDTVFCSSKSLLQLVCWTF